MSIGIVPEIDHRTKLQPGVRGTIAISSGMNKGRYPSSVNDVEDGVVYLSHPMLKGASLPVYKDMSFTFTMEDSGSLYEFEMSAIRSSTKRGMPELFAELSGAPKKIQRRHYLRMPCKWDVMVFLLDQELIEPQLCPWKPATALDISLRGTRFRIDSDDDHGVYFESGDKLMMRFHLYGKEYFQAGSATRIVHDDDGWEVGMGFDSVAEKVEKKIFEYIRQQEIMGREEQ